MVQIIKLRWCYHHEQKETKTKLKRKLKERAPFQITIYMNGFKKIFSYLEDVCNKHSFNQNLLEENDNCLKYFEFDKLIYLRNLNDTISL
jgi:hypothetical protein